MKIEGLYEYLKHLKRGINIPANHEKRFINLINKKLYTNATNKN